jgi:hypothetical protein
MNAGQPQMARITRMNTIKNKFTARATIISLIRDIRVIRGKKNAAGGYIHGN